MSSRPKLNYMKPPSYCRKSNREMERRSPPSRLQVSNPAKLLQLCENLNDTCTQALEVKINRYIIEETDATTSFIIHLLPISEEILVQVIGAECLPRPPTRYGIPSEDLMNLIYLDDNTFKCTATLPASFTNFINNLLPESNKMVVTVPILKHGAKLFSCNPNINATPIMLVCVVNSSKHESFIIKVVNELFRHCLTLLSNTQKCEDERREKMQCQTLLSVARRLLSHLDDVEDLLKEIMFEARQLTNAERCSLFLFDHNKTNLVAKVFEGFSSTSEVKIPSDQGIAGTVATTGQLLNIKDAYSNPLFYKGMDEATGFVTRNLLCFPIRNETGIIGVAQLCNKRTGNFDLFDEEASNSFSIYCGLTIIHSLVYQQIKEAQARNTLANELMMYHMKVKEEDILKKMFCNQSHENPLLDNWNFSPRSILPESTCFAMKMFDDLDFTSTYEISRKTLTKFIIFVERGYRNPPYHNWGHAFAVAHFAYLAIKNLQLIQKKYLTKLEAFALLVSCLCHDIDHRGTNNSFQQQSNSIMASLYSSQGSVLERHHLSQTIRTLNTEGCNVLKHLYGDDYKLCLDYIKDMILSTDLAHHFKILPLQMEMAKVGFKHNKPDHCYHFICLLMTCGDLSDQIKPYSLVKNVAQDIYEEFFAQGDLEKKMGRKVIPMMDRDAADIPAQQIMFLENVVLPVFQVLGKLLPAAKELPRAVKRNMFCWECSKSIFKEDIENGKLPTEVLKSEDLMERVLSVVKTLHSGKTILKEINKAEEEISTEASDAAKIKYSELKMPNV